MLCVERNGENCRWCLQNILDKECLLQLILLFFSATPELGHVVMLHLVTQHLAVYRWLHEDGICMHVRQIHRRQ